jgi:hypothetical protein
MRDEIDFWRLDKAAKVESVVRDINPLIHRARAAGAFGFLLLIQCGVRPAGGDPLRHQTGGRVSRCAGLCLMGGLGGKQLRPMHGSACACGTVTRGLAAA